MNYTVKTSELYDLSHTAAVALLERCEYPWQALSQIGAFIKELIPTLGADYVKLADDVYVHKTAKIHRSADISGPCVIGADTEVRPSAFIRGNALIGSGCVIGNSCEVKNAIIFDKSQVPHFNYGGDSILGYHAHMGAGAVTSNVKSDNSDVVIKCCGETLPTGRRKVGAFLGDNAEIGCNSVLNPGTVVGRGARVYPLSMVRGVAPAHSIYKKAGEIVEIRDCAVN